MTDQNALKRAVAAKALEYVQSGMKLGLGSGSTAETFVELLAAHPSAKNLTCVPTSEKTAALARKQGLTREEFFSHYLEVHAPLGMELTRTMAADVEYWPTHDPTGMEGNREQKLEAYREVCDTLLLRIRKRFSKVGAASG